MAHIRESFHTIVSVHMKSKSVSALSFSAQRLRFPGFLGQTLSKLLLLLLALDCECV